MMLTLHYWVALLGPVSSLTIGALSSSSSSSSSSYRSSVSSRNASVSSTVTARSTVPVVPTSNVVVPMLQVSTVYRTVELTVTKLVDYCACPSSKPAAAAAGQANVAPQNGAIAAGSPAAVQAVGNNQVSGASNGAQPQSGSSGAVANANAGTGVNGNGRVTTSVYTTVFTVYQAVPASTYITTFTNPAGSRVVQTSTTISTITQLVTSTVTQIVTQTSVVTAAADQAAVSASSTLRPIYSNSTMSTSSQSSPNDIAPFTVPTSSTILPNGGAGVGGQQLSTSTTSTSSESSMLIAPTSTSQASSTSVVIVLSSAQSQSFVSDGATSSSTDSSSLPTVIVLSSTSESLNAQFSETPSGSDTFMSSLSYSTTSSVEFKPTSTLESTSTTTSQSQFFSESDTSSAVTSTSSLETTSSSSVFSMSDLPSSTSSATSESSSTSESIIAIDSSSTSSSSSLDVTSTTMSSDTTSMTMDSTSAITTSSSSLLESSSTTSTTTSSVVSACRATGTFATFTDGSRFDLQDFQGQILANDEGDSSSFFINPANNLVVNSGDPYGVGAQCYGISGPGTFSVVDCNTCDSVSTNNPVNYCLQLSTENTLVLSPETPYNVYIDQVNSDFSGLVGRNAAPAAYTFIFTQASDSCPAPVPSTPTTPVITVTQVVQNGGFETDDGSGTYTSPWTRGPNSYVESNTNNAWQARSGTHFAVMYTYDGPASFTQTLQNLLPGNSYMLQYSYQVQWTANDQGCTFQVLLGNDVVDTLDTTSLGPMPTQYNTRSIPVSPTAASQTLQFLGNCDSSNEYDLCLDDISLTLSTS